MYYLFCLLSWHIGLWIQTLPLSVQLRPPTVCYNPIIFIFEHLDWFETENSSYKSIQFTIVVLKLLKWKSEFVKKISNFEFIDDLNLLIQHSPGKTFLFFVITNRLEICFLSNPVYEFDIFPLLFCVLQKVVVDYFSISDIVICLILFFEKSQYLTSIVLNFPNCYSSILNNLIQTSLILANYRTRLNQCM
jgi:hypothetical protein